jgi:two-component system sensor kinase FixL
MEWWEERLHSDDRKKVTDSLERAVQRGTPRWSATYRFRQANGDYATFFDRGFLVRDEKGEVTRFVGAMTDLSERQRSEQEIRRMQAELIHVSRLSAMGTMGSTLAHELNQPLTAVTNYVRGSRRLLANGEKDDVARACEGLEAAEAAALRAGQIVRRLRELVARGTAAMRPENLPKLIDEAGVIAFLDAPFMGITPRIELDPAAEWVEADRIQIQQVLINLIRNAVQATRNSERREVVVSTARTAGGQIEVSVADTGGGIAPDVREALFSPFQGTKAEGLGIGLSISRTIVEAHSGKIWADDREGGGTVFRFTLPATDQPAEA